ncbi:aspartic-type endopeptidase-like protein [Lasiosphaeria miniovina]|uniref:Aspartic-type endopeptidase-like protein n=1 Tax=Lasiosphaeria miniovina TaxID=1954250 RepID=A0AA40DJR8_9PEZI|nr:aspartic-type endopeptidase-like protein [Lasiosphaeria miniovina]KAK0706174.1 aspartic-type endopeptidase-like protein [Lasiosphaeria miniovina]
MKIALVNLLAYGAALVGAVALIHPHRNVLEAPPPGFSYKLPKAFHPGSAFRASQASDNVQRLRGVRGTKTNVKSVAAVLGAHQRQVGGFGYENITTTTAYGTQYATEAVWDGIHTWLLLDTGSSDTWAVGSNFTCVDYAGEFLPQGACGFGPPGPEKFAYGYTQPEQHMFIQYGDGEIVSGPMGFSDIAFGNITVRQQEVCLANTTFWYGNNLTSGLMGLGFPSLTNAYLGSSDDHDPDNQIEYSPVFTSMVSQGQVPPVFSIAIDRNSSSGILAWGGIAPAVGADFSQIASLDLIITNLIELPVTAYEYSFYTVIPDGWLFDQNTNTKKYPYIVDSGTTLCYLPPPLAEAINLAFQPSAVYLWMYGAYFTSCNAVPPTISVKLGGIDFWLNPVDLIYRNMVDPLTGLCMTAIASGGSGPYILGDAFMQNAVVVFDVGEAKMRFIPRPFY